MLLERIYDEDLAQASYFIGCQAKGEAIVIDPRRDIDVYLDLAEKNGMRIVAVTETHIHADYLSGTRELAARTGARMHVSDEGGPDWTYGPDFDSAVRMKHGHRIRLGNITVEASHTPGHTPEHLSFLITDGAQASEPGFMLTGDFVFVGDLGRPDLLDEAAGFVDTRFRGARDLPHLARLCAGAAGARLRFGVRQSARRDPCVDRRLRAKLLLVEPVSEERRRTGLRR
jgi:hydroxyacylglutathione hydrolase